MARVTDTFPPAGVLADRPVDPGSVPAFYSATDTNLIYRWDGTTWGTWASGATDPEVVRDTIGNALVAGANVTITPDDAGDTTTISATDTNTTDPEVVRDTMAATLVAGANVTITPDDTGDTITIAATGSGGGGSGLFRGEWAADALLYSDNLTSPLSAAWALFNSTSFAGSGGPNSTYPNYLQVGNANGATHDGTATLTTASVPALADTSLTRIVFWGRDYRYDGSTLPTFKVNGTTVLTLPIVGPNAYSPWTEYTVNLGATNPTLQWNAVDYDWNVAGVRIYGTAQPYMSGQFVVYQSNLYRSAIDNNASTPGTDANWVLVPVTDPEVVRDTIGATLVAGANVTITPNDAGNTITISAAGGGGGGTSGVLLLESGQGATDVPSGTPIGTLIFIKGA